LNTKHIRELNSKRSLRRYLKNVNYASIKKKKKNLILTYSNRFQNIYVQLIINFENKLFSTYNRFDFATFKKIKLSNLIQKKFL